MQLKKNVKFVVLLTVLLSATYLWCGCETQRVTYPHASEEVNTDVILEELSSANTQADAKTAINHLFDKTGIGVPESRYEFYGLSDETIDKLSTAQLLFLENNGENGLTLGEIAELVEFSGDFDRALQDLQKQATAALAEPEDPNNAFLIAVAAEGDTVPNSIPLYDSDTVLSPVQDTLFVIWLDSESEKYIAKAPAKDIDLDELKPPLPADTICKTRCWYEFKINIITCFLTYPTNPAKRKQCLKFAYIIYKWCWQECHDQGRVQ